jgi:hypothetical protein
MKHKLLTTTLIIFLLAVFPAVALAGSAILHWQAVSAPDLAGYRIYYGISSRSYGPYIPLDKNVTSYTLNALVEGRTYYFALTAVDTSGNESGFSQEVSKLIPTSGGGSGSSDVSISLGTAPDFDREGSVDILWRNYSTGENAIWLMKETSILKYVAIGKLDNLDWHIVGTGDFNNDGYVDILWRNYSTGENSVWLMKGTGTLKYVALGKLDNLDWHIVGTGDFNRDGYFDILWRNYSTGENAVWLMKGMGTLKYVALSKLDNLDWHIVGTGDFNRDGYVDILWRNYSNGSNVIWYLKGTSVTTYVNIPAVTNFDWEAVS